MLHQSKQTPPPPQLSRDKKSLEEKLQEMQTALEGEENKSKTEHRSRLKLESGLQDSEEKLDREAKVCVLTQRCHLGVPVPFGGPGAIWVSRCHLVVPVPFGGPGAIWVSWCHLVVLVPFGGPGAIWWSR